MQKSWDDQIASIRRDAKFAIAYAYWAVEEAEYRVLDATLARMDADSLAGTGS